ncbi:MAG: alpha-mannosyltransferase [Solirubrobacteraceae bacterium]
MTPSAELRVAAQLRALARSEHPYPEDRFAGRGIVMCAGGARMFTCAWVALSVLRRVLGCQLPIEVWHLGEQELGVAEAALLAELDVTTVDALSVRGLDPARSLGGWELKPYALANSRFREVLMLDADNIAVRDPSAMFESDAYTRAGALFWPDVTWLQAESEIWEICGVEPRTEPAWESGQLLLDKERCWAPLQLARYMNDHSDVFYRYLYGDKDTFHLAWRMLDWPHAMIQARPRVLDYGLLQHDLNGMPLFQHRNQMKWVLRGENQVAHGFAHGEECLAALADLDRRWSGRIEPLPERSAPDLALESDLATLRVFRLRREGSDETMLELLPGNRVGDGRTKAWLRWYVVDGELVLAGVSGETARLARAEGGEWIGHSLQRGRQPISLASLPAVHSPDPVAAVVAALLERVAAGAMVGEEALTAIVTLGEIVQMAPILARERVRWPEASPAARVIEDARWRLGRRDPSLRAEDGGDRRRYAAG